jgi:hypothetical protein
VVRRKEYKELKSSRVWGGSPIIPAMQEVENGRLQFKATSSKKIVRPHHNKTIWEWWSTPVT